SSAGAWPTRSAHRSAAAARPSASASILRRAPACHDSRASGDLARLGQPNAFGVTRGARLLASEVRLNIAAVDCGYRRALPYVELTRRSRVGRGGYWPCQAITSKGPTTGHHHRYADCWVRAPMLRFVLPLVIAWVAALAPSEHDSGEAALRARLSRPGGLTAE